MYCGICGGLLMFMGWLGKLAHYNCRDCGMWSSSEDGPDEDLEET